ncbi:MAG: right-handed parallel beta-helix repeat-containing protein [Anaerolineae bacterium]|nr:right-handed parallel beta-helix repeat-containing protein [Anaerolineae bacterium]
MVGEDIANSRRLIFGLMLGGVLLLGLSLLLKGSTPAAQASPGIWFVQPGGAGTGCSRANPCALQTALAQADNGDTIYLAQGTYTGAGGAVITITKSITLYGGWDGSPTGPVMRDPEAYPTMLDGEGARRGVYISGAVSPVLDGLIITDGSAAGLGGYGSTDAGGGVYVSEADVFLNNCVVFNNTAGANGAGGGIFLTGSDARVENSSVVSNTARWGGGIRVVSGAPVLRFSEVISNTAHFGGGVYLMWTRSGALVESNVFQGNSSFDGGAIYLSAATATIRANLIYSNRSGLGGGVGVASGSTPAVLSGNRIWGNSAQSGGGVYIWFNPTYLDNNFIVDNQVTEEGAGIYVYKAKPALVHNTLARNTGGDGSGVFVDVDAAAVLTNTIIVSHTVGITVTAGSTATLEATLWGSNAWANDTDWGGDGAILTGAVNIWGDPVFVDPDGGDYHIGPGSAAMNAGVGAGITTDIDGDPRPMGAGYDIGADEYATRAYLPMVTRSH